MPFVRFNIEEEIEKQCRESESFREAWEKNQKELEQEEKKIGYETQPKRRMGEEISDILGIDKKEKIIYRAKTTPKDGNQEFNEVWVQGDLIHSGNKVYIHPITNKVHVQGEIGKLIVMHEVIPETVSVLIGK